MKMVGRMDRSDLSVEVWRGSEAELILSSSSASTFESLDSSRRVNFAPVKSNEDEPFLVEQPSMDTDEEFYEDPLSP